MDGIWDGECVIGPAAGDVMHQWEHSFVAVPENWFNTSMAEFYYPKDFDQAYLDELAREGKQPHYIDGNKPDPVEALYSDVALPELYPSQDTYGICTYSDPDAWDNYDKKDEPEVIKIILSYGLSDSYSMDSAHIGKLCMRSKC